MIHAQADGHRDTRVAPPRPSGWTGEVVGATNEARLLDGSARRFVNLDNAATTPALVAVQQAVLDYLPWYSSVHRGAGFKSRLSTAIFEEARAAIGACLGIDETRQDVIFVKSATEGLNKVAHGLAGTGATVFTTLMEHHANLLPWQVHAAAVRYIQTDDDGVIDEEDLARQLRAAPSGPKLVAVSGAYNISGYSPPVHRLAALAHAHDAEILVDGAQFVPHHVVSVRGHVPGEEIDYLVFSAHKIYAPFGLGVLIAPRRFFHGTPDVVGGGAAARVTPDDVVWAELPDREEAGSPNVIGVVALAAALRRLEQLGRGAVGDYETRLTAYASERLAGVPGLTLLGPCEGRVAILTFVLAGLPHDLVAAILGYEHGIGVRAGLFCAHQGVRRLLRAVPDPILGARCAGGETRSVAGAVRASLALYNTPDDIDALVSALTSIARGERAGRYVRHASGDYQPEGWRPEYDTARSWLAGAV
jgi:cysteine desulfurase/selenocysteine lyase